MSFCETVRAFVRAIHCRPLNLSTPSEHRVVVKCPICESQSVQLVERDGRVLIGCPCGCDQNEIRDCVKEAMYR